MARVALTAAASRISLPHHADEATLQHVVDAYLGKYGWPVTVRDGAFFDTEGAFGLPHDDTSSPTRWRFGD